MAHKRKLPSIGTWEKIRPGHYGRIINITRWVDGEDHVHFSKRTISETEYFKRKLAGTL